MKLNKISKINLDFIDNSYFKKKLIMYLENIFELNYNIKAILLFGSVAKGNARYNDEYISDIDLIIISNDLDNDLWNRNQEVFELTKEYCSGVQALWWTPEEIREHVDSKYYLILDALDEGKILYDPEDFLLELRQKLREDLNKKGVIKTDLYWQWPIKYFGEKIDF